MWMASAGLQRGFIHGQSAEPGFDREQPTYRFRGRDFRLTDMHEKIVKEIPAERTALAGRDKKHASSLPPLPQPLHHPGIKRRQKLQLLVPPQPSPPRRGQECPHSVSPTLTRRYHARQNVAKSSSF